METSPDLLPDDVAALRAELIAARAKGAQIEAELAVAKAKASEDLAVIARQKLRIEKLERQLYGPKAERHARLIDHMEFQLAELEMAATRPDQGNDPTMTTIELNEQQAHNGAKLLQAIAHPKRLLLLAVLADRRLSAGRLAAAVGLPSGLVYKHLHTLVESGLLRVSAKSAGMCFSFKLTEIQAVLAAQIPGNVA